MLIGVAVGLGGLVAVGAGCAVAVGAGTLVAVGGAMVGVGTAVSAGCEGTIAVAGSVAATATAVGVSASAVDLLVLAGVLSSAAVGPLVVGWPPLNHQSKTASRRVTIVPPMPKGARPDLRPGLPALLTVEADVGKRGDERVAERGDERVDERGDERVDLAIDYVTIIIFTKEK